MTYITSVILLLLLILYSIFPTVEKIKNKEQYKVCQCKSSCKFTVPLFAISLLRSLFLRPCAVAEESKFRSLSVWIVKHQVAHTLEHPFNRQTDRQRFVPVGTCAPSLSPAELLATITRFVELLLDKLHCSCPVLQTGTLGVTLTSYIVYVVANTEAVHVMVDRRLSPVCVTFDGGHGAERAEAEVTSKLRLQIQQTINGESIQESNY